MYIERKEREELQALSKDTLGKPNAYQKFLDGVPELVTMTKTVAEPSKENPDMQTTREVKVPVLQNGVKQYRTRYYTVTEVKEMLTKMKATLDEIRATMAKQKAEQETKKKLDDLARQVAMDNNGSAV